MGTQIVFDAAVYVDLRLIGLLQPSCFADKPGQIRGAGCPIVFSGNGAVDAQTDGGQPAVDRRADHPFQACAAVVKPAVRVQVLESHLTIFSCLTLRSMTCRPAISFLISSREMPISSISTMV